MCSPPSDVYFREGSKCEEVCANHGKRKPYLNMVQKRLRVLWVKTHLKWTASKWERVLCSDESKFLLVGNHGHSVLQAEQEGDLPACYCQGLRWQTMELWGKQDTNAGLADECVY